VRGFAAALLLVASAAGADRDARAQRLGGHAELSGFGYADRLNESDPWVLGRATLFAKWETPFPLLEGARLVASARAETWTSAEEGPLVFDPADRALRRTPLSVRELFLRLPLAPSFDLTIGRMELGWGKTDGYSPADAFLPRDLSDPFADEKLPLWGVRLQGQRGAVRLDAFAAATTTPWRLPVLTGRNAPLPVPGVQLVDGESRPPRAGFGAVRLLGTFGAWDLGVWGRAGVRPAPLLEFEIPAASADAALRIRANRRYTHEEGGGVELSRLLSGVLDGWVLRAEAAALFSRDRELGNALLWTVSLERGFGDGTLLAIFAANARGEHVDPLLLFDRALLPGLILAWSRSERWGSWRVAHTTAFEHGDGLLVAEVAWQAADAWRVLAGGDYPYGSRFGVFGARGASRRLRLSLRRSW